MKLSGNTVLITGGASGIGYALTKKFVEHGNVVLVVGRDVEKLNKLRADYPNVITLKCDVGVEAERLTLVEHLKQQHLLPNILVNNAGIQYNYWFDQEQPSYEIMQGEIDINFMGPARLSALLIPYLRANSESAIVNLSSALGLTPKASAPVYCASKAALSIFSRALRYQLESTSVKVFNIVTPLVDTNMTQGRGKGKISPDTFAAVLLNGMERDKYDLLIGKTRLLYVVYRLFPALAYKILKNGL